MKTVKNLSIILIIFFITTCTFDDNDRSAPSSLLNTEEEKSAVSLGSTADAVLLHALTVNNLTIVNEKTTGADTGYAVRNSHGKSFLILQGSSYSMGYQMGALMAPEVETMATEFIRNIAASTFGIDYDTAPALIDFLINEALILCRLAVQNGDIPANLIEEMYGVVDGAASEGYHVSFNNILLLNCGSDSIYSIMYTGSLPSFNDLDELLKENPSYRENIQIMDKRVYFPRAQDLQFGCNGFVVTGNATRNSGTYHGRDFMYSTGGMYQDLAYVAVYLPDTGYPFASVSAPGWVCAPTAFNSEGVSMGTEVVMSEAVNLEPGIGCLMVIRDTVQHSANLDEAIEHIKSLKRGVPWLYVLADDTVSERYSNGVIVESGRQEPPFTGPDLLPSCEQWYLSGAPVYFFGASYNTAKDYISLLDQEILPDRGVMTRDMSWEFPEEFEGIDKTVDIAGVGIGIYFPEQRESWPDAVLCTNHYIIPRMRFTSLSPWMMIQPFLQTKTSFHRYEKLYEILDLEYGAITFEKARHIIDYLNPNSVYRSIVDREYYEPGDSIKGHHAVINNSTRELMCLYGYYGSEDQEESPWVYLDLRPFCE